MFQVIIRVFLFILNLKIRRPFPQVICKNYGQQTLKNYRKLQRLQLQRDKSLCDLEFLQRCKQCGIFPKFVYFRSSIRNFSNSKLYVSILHKCLNYEIRSKQRKFTRLSRTYSNLCDQFKTEVSWLDYKVFLARLTRDNTNKINNVKRVHSKKLAALGVPETGILDPNKVIFNFSDRVLTYEEKEILKFGLQFSVPEKKCKFVDYFLHYEKVLQQFSKHKSNNEYFEELIHKTKHLAQEGFKYNPLAKSNHKLNLKTLDNLKNDETLIITKPDKGRGIVILNKLDYISKTK